VGADRSVRRAWIASGLSGIAIGVALRFAGGAGAAPVARIVALAFLATAPLAFAVSRIASGGSPRLRVALAVAQPVGAACAVVSLWATGRAAWLLALPWVVVAGLAALIGRKPLYTRAGWREPATLCDALALLYFPVGAMWLVVSRAQMTPFGLSPAIVELTIVHFHYAGLAALVLASRGIEATAGRPGVRRVAAGAGIGVAVGIPVVAAGITASPAVGLVGSVVLAGSLLVYAVLSLAFVVRTLKSSLARVLAVVSALSLLLSMPLAIFYAWGEATGERIVLFDAMVRLHGFANAHGFAVCGLLAWIAEDRRRRAG
jgi:hypothetical protein